MRLMNEVLRPFIGTFIVVYLDDILVYSYDETSYVEHLSQVFQVLRQPKFYVKLEKCEPFILKLSFLAMLYPMREFKLMNLRLRLSRIGLLPPPSWKYEASMG